MCVCVCEGDVVCLWRGGGGGTCLCVCEGGVVCVCVWGVVCVCVGGIVWGGGG